MPQFTQSRPNPVKNSTRRPAARKRKQITGNDVITDDKMKNAFPVETRKYFIFKLQRRKESSVQSLWQFLRSYGGELVMETGARFSPT